MFIVDRSLWLVGVNDNLSCLPIPDTYMIVLHIEQPDSTTRVESEAHVHAH